MMARRGLPGGAEGFAGYRSIWGLRGRVVVIAEKPKAAMRIKDALAAGGRARAMRYRGVPYWVISRGSLTIVVAPAAGHLYGLYTEERGYPSFNYTWKPLYIAEKGAGYTRKFIELLDRVCRGASYYVNACDYDIEGSVIGYLIIKHHGRLERALRAKYSSLTVSELREAFNRLEPLDTPMVEAGLARHELDWIWGINVSRALMDAVKRASGKRVTLSAGRVQTPTLRAVVEAEVERNLYIPVPQYTLTAKMIHRGREYQLEYTGPVFETRAEAAREAEAIKAEGRLIVSRVDERVERLRQPYPFNLGDLQEEASRIYGFSPYKTQSIAEELYINAYISYPRTNSQKLPRGLNYRGILSKLASIPRYRGLVERLLEETRGVLKPVEGPKTDPAHPAIYPTGVVPRGLSDDQWKIYDLIVRRFLAVFAEPALARHVVVKLRPVGAGRASFQVTGLRVIREGWLRYYGFHRPREREAPQGLREGMRVPVAGVGVRKGYTRPPERFSRIKLLRWMERNEIGTEATRARIIEILYKRGYLRSEKGKAVATDLGLGLIEVLDKYFSELTSVEMTRKFEKAMEMIRLGRYTRRQVIEEAKETIKRLLDEFSGRREEVGRLLAWRLGISSPPRRCRLCRREAVDGNGLCSYHAAALERLRSMYKEWARREGVGWDEYVRAVKRLPSTGRWVKDVVGDERLLSSMVPEG